MVGDIGERLAHFRFRRQSLALGVDESFEFDDQGLGALLPDGATLRGR